MCSQCSWHDVISGNSLVMTIFSPGISARPQCIPRHPAGHLTSHDMRKTLGSASNEGSKFKLKVIILTIFKNSVYFMHLLP